MASASPEMKQVRAGGSFADWGGLEAIEALGVPVLETIWWGATARRDGSRGTRPDGVMRKRERHTIRS